MYALVILIHIVACSLLILIVLIQQGRGGGLIDTMSSAESIFGTKTNVFLVKATSVLAVLFFFTCLSLAFLSIQKSKSLIETNYKPAAASTVPPVVPATAASASASSKTPAVTVPAAPVSSPAPKTEAPAQTKTAPSTQTAQTPLAS